VERGARALGHRNLPLSDRGRLDHNAPYAPCDRLPSGESHLPIAETSGYRALSTSACTKAWFAQRSVLPTLPLIAKGRGKRARSRSKPAQQCEVWRRSLLRDVSAAARRLVGKPASESVSGRMNAKKESAMLAAPRIECGGAVCG
jgi:hypothetical protein